MEKKILIKADEGKYLLFKEDEKGFRIQLFHKLSKQNCDELFGVVDVLDLVERNSKHSEYDYIEGFNKAMELNKDKVFTLEDIEKAIDMARKCNSKQGIIDIDAVYPYSDDFNDVKPIFSRNEIINSLQQPTEIEVDFDTETLFVGKCNCPCHHPGNNIIHFMACCIPTRVDSPKLDSDGYLILKKVDYKSYKQD